MDVGVYVIVCSAILLKAGLFVMCYILRDASDSTLVLAQDHKNDVLSNTVVVIAAAVATSFNHKLGSLIDENLCFVVGTGTLIRLAEFQFPYLLLSLG